MKTLTEEKMSLTDQIKTATSEGQINQLLRDGSTAYRDASPKTQRRWVRAANERKAALRFK